MWSRDRGEGTFIVRSVEADGEETTSVDEDAGAIGLGRSGNELFWLEAIIGIQKLEKSIFGHFHSPRVLELLLGVEFEAHPIEHPVEPMKIFFFYNCFIFDFFVIEEVHFLFDFLSLGWGLLEEVPSPEVRADSQACLRLRASCSTRSDSSRSSRSSMLGYTAEPFGSPVWFKNAFNKLFLSYFVILKGGDEESLFIIIFAFSPIFWSHFFPPSGLR